MEGPHGYDHNEDEIRREVDRKIIIQSEELKNRRLRKKNEESESSGGFFKKLKRDKKNAKTGDKIESNPKSSVVRNRELEKYRTIANISSQMSEYDYSIQDYRTYSGDDYAPDYSGPVKAVCIVMAVLIVIMSFLDSATYADYRAKFNKYTAIAEMPKFSEDKTIEVVRDKNIFEKIPDAKKSRAESIEEGKKVLSLVLSSSEKDMKIRLVDDNQDTVKGIKWGVVVTEEDGDKSDYDDEDEDGIIYLTKVPAGNYSVALKKSRSLTGYRLPSKAQTVSVKDAIEYKVIASIKDIVKKESEVDAKAEDTSGDVPADEESADVLKDTVEWVESTKTPMNGESFEESTVDLSKLKALSSSGSKKHQDVWAKVLSRYVSWALEIEDYELIGAGFGLKKCGLRNLNVIENPATDGRLRHMMIAAEEEEEADEGVVEVPDDQAVTPTPTETPTVVPTAKPDDTISPTPISDITSTPTEVPTATTAPTSTPTPTTEPVATTTPTPIPTMPVATTTPTPAPTLIDTAKSVAISCLNNTIEAGSTTNVSATVYPINDVIISWVSSNPAVATVVMGVSTGNAVVTGVSRGSAIITATSGMGATASVTITVTGDGKYSSDAQLYDRDDNELFVYDGGVYRLAKYEDYISGLFTKFYKRSAGYLYTGWQTIENKTYYYTRDHQFVTGDQVIGGVPYHFGLDGVLAKSSGVLGIDISKYQPDIIWESVKKSGIEYVIIRCGYRGAATGSLIQDPYFTSHIKGAQSVGLKVGIYFFSTAMNETEAVEEASMCAMLCSGNKISYPIFIDVESSNRAGYNSLTVEERTDNIRAFCKTIKSAGYVPGVYANKTWLTTKIDADKLSEYKIWLAQYNPSGPTYEGRYDLWQYTSKGSINGIKGNVDMDKSYLENN